MEIEFDQDKRDKTLQERGLDFAGAAEVFAGPTLTEQDADSTMARVVLSPWVF